MYNYSVFHCEKCNELNLVKETDDPFSTFGLRYYPRLLNVNISYSFLPNHRRCKKPFKTNKFFTSNTLYPTIIRYKIDPDLYEEVLLRLL